MSANPTSTAPVQMQLFSVADGSTNRDPIVMPSVIPSVGPSRNPFDGLRPALELISKEAQVLPATGQAMEDLMRPDHAEVIDQLRTGAGTTFDEIIERGNRAPYVRLEPLHRQERHLIRYFIDGSARTFFLGDILQGTRRSPVHVSQIGVASIFRRDDGKVNVARSMHRIALMLDKSQVSFGDEIEHVIAQTAAMGPFQFGFCDTMDPDGETEKTSGKGPRSRAAHKAHHLMAQEEQKLGRELLRNPEDWLLLDGSLGKDLYAWKDITNYFGLAKSFSRQPMFKKPGSSRHAVNLYQLLVDLEFSARTCAFSARDGEVAVWYVRLREQRHLDYPLMGVVKVELPNPTREAVSSETIDLLSSALVVRQASNAG